MKTSFLTGTLYRGVFNVWDVDNLQFVFFYRNEQLPRDFRLDEGLFQMTSFTYDDIQAKTDRRLQVNLYEKIRERR